MVETVDVFINEPPYFTPENLDEMLIVLYGKGASDITLQSGERVFAEIKGQLCPATKRTMSLQEVSDLINHIYGANATAQIYSGKDIDTNYRVRHDERAYYRFRVNVTGCQFEGYSGLQITLRALSDKIPTLDELGVADELRACMDIPQGVLILSGATGSGKTTMMASMIAHQIREQDSNLKVVTYEAPIEYVFDGIDKPSSIVSQTEIPRHLPSFAAGVRNAMRRKPGVIMVGEARDAETLESVIEASLTGHPVYTTVHSNSVVDTFRRMVTIFPAEERDSRLYDLIETLRVIIWQALVRGTSGELVPLREYLVMSEGIRAALCASPTNKILEKMKELMGQYGHTINEEVEQKHQLGLICDKVKRRFIR